MKLPIYSFVIFIYLFLPLRRLQWSTALYDSPSEGAKGTSSGVLMELIVPNNQGGAGSGSGGSLSIEV